MQGHYRARLAGRPFALVNARRAKTRAARSHPGIVERRPKPKGRGSVYELTPRKAVRASSVPGLVLGCHTSTQLPWSSFDTGENSYWRPDASRLIVRLRHRWFPKRFHPVADRDVVG